MIDSFKVKANKEKNLLLVQLRGYFMKSELELAFYLARKEVKSLKEGFEVILDFDGMFTDKSIGSVISHARRVFITLGAGKIRCISALEKLTSLKPIVLEYLAFDNVGFYPN